MGKQLICLDCENYAICKRNRNRKEKSNICRDFNSKTIEIEAVSRAFDLALDKLSIIFESLEGPQDISDVFGEILDELEEEE